MTKPICTGNMFHFICTCVLDSAVATKFHCFSQNLQGDDIYFFQLFAMNQKMAWKITENVKGFIIGFFYGTWHTRLFGEVCENQIHNDPCRLRLNFWVSPRLWLFSTPLWSFYYVSIMTVCLLKNPTSPLHCKSHLDL